MLDNLYGNIGGKIKGLAKWTFIVEAIGAIITGIVLMCSDSTLMLYGLLTIFFGPIVAFVSTWILYGFGELIDNTAIIARHFNGGKIKSEAQTKAESERINNLDRLRSKGLITEEEYQKAVSKEQ